MTIVDDFVRRNRAFAKREKAAGSFMPDLGKALPNVKALVIGCADMRVDPADVLGMKLGEAVVIRNIGGRVTPGLFEMLGLLGQVGANAHAIPGGGGPFNIIVLQHTDCGMTRLGSETAALAHYFSIDESKLGEKSVMDPPGAVAVDVARLRAFEGLPAEWLVTGAVYDVATGLVDVVVPTAPLRSSA